MAPAAAPDERVLVLVPVCSGTLDSLLDLGPGVEPSALESQRAQHLPPRLDEVQVGRILRLEDELPAWVGQGEQQHVDAAVDVEVVDDGVDPLGSGLDPALDADQEVDPVRGGPALVGRGEGGACGRLQRAEHVARDTQAHEYELYLAVEDIDHSRTKTKSPQTNGICERFHRTVLHEFYQVAFRKRVYGSVEQLQADLDAWVADYNERRPHQGRWCYGKTPLQTFVDTVPLAKEKMLAAA